MLLFLGFPNAKTVVEEDGVAFFDGVVDKAVA